MSITDFNASRDNRENCRLSIVTCLELLGKLAGLKKIDDKVFADSQDPSISSSSSSSSQSVAAQSPSLLSTITQLWAMTDRTIRTALLTQLKTMVDLISSQTLNKVTSIISDIVFLLITATGLLCVLHCMWS